jgi:hypothetical protein
LPAALLEQTAGGRGGSILLKKALKAYAEACATTSDYPPPYPRTRAVRTLARGVRAGGAAALSIDRVQRLRERIRLAGGL